MSTRDRSEKLAAARKKLKKFQSSNAQKTSSSQPLLDTDLPLLTVPAPETSILLQTMQAAPEPTKPTSYLLTSLSLTTPTDTFTTVANGYISSLPKRPLTLTDPLTSSRNVSSEHLYNGSHTHLQDQTDNHTHLHNQTDGHTHSHKQESNQVDSDTVPHLEQHVQAHAQTIDILVSEKASLQSQISSLHTDLRNRTREVEDLTGHLQSTRQQLEENERIKLSLVEEKALMERTLSQVRSRREESETSLQRVRAALDDTRQENTELISKVTGQAAELHSLQKANMELQSKLNMAELLTQQLSAESLSPSARSDTLSGLTNQLDELRSEAERLEGVVRSVRGERDQALSDLDALRDAMIQQQQDSARKLSELHSRLAASEAERLSGLEQLQDVRKREEELAQHASTEHAQFQQSAQVVMETLQQEKEELQTQLQSQVEESRRLYQLSEQRELRAVEAEREGARLREAAVDSRRLLDTMSRDKEALSRAVAQNKELKAQLVELQDAFVRLSEQNMQLATEVETERFNVTQLQAKLQRNEEVLKRAEEVERIEVATQADGEGGEEEEEVRRGQWTVGGEDMEVEGEPLPEHPHLTELLQATEEERDTLHNQLQALCEERDGLRQEVLQLQSQMRTLTSAEHHNDSPHSTNGRGSPHEDSVGRSQDTPVADLTQDILSSLQANFNALQERYVAVMADKAELLELVEQKELTIGQLSGEADTIGEYITLYQSQREALRAKFKEKDNFIQQLISDKESVQAQLGEVQRLTKQLLLERTDPQIHRATTSTSHSPPPSSPSSLPLHLRPLTYHHPNSHPSPSPSPSPPMSSSKTAEQIFQLLAVMGEGGEDVRGVVVPCACCTGDVIVV